MPNNGKYRGGFRSSICDLFKDPSRRTDCCALAFLGIFSYDRTNHLLTKHYNNGDGEEAIPWRRKLFLRFLIFVFLPATVAILSNLLVKNPSVKMIMFWSYVLFLFVLLCRTLHRRRINRMRLLKVVHERNLREEMLDQAEIDNHEVQRFVHSHRGDVSRVHGISIFTYRDDIDSSTAAFTLSSPMDNDEPNGDFCTSIWNFFKGCCCGVFCICWLQCCGICAIAQEEREINLLLPKSAQMIDYISFQPFEEYYHSIQSLRNSANGSFIDHLHSLSELSKVILQSLLSFLVLALLFSLTGINENFTIAHFFVLLGVFGQAFVILYLVHWRWHRFDLSLDAVIKYFASGFFISLSFALVYGILLQILMLVVLFITIEMEFASDEEFTTKLANQTTSEEKRKLLIGFIRNHRFVILFFVFIFAFIVTALVEEMSKYFGFWMVDHPDFVMDDNLEEQESCEDENASDDNLHLVEKRSLSQIGTATTIGLVTAATGFACIENVMYVFGYSPAGLESEIITFLIRAILPVHPICAAIQSIGICKRDLEKDQSMGLGKALFPAILLHGIYDFVLMASSTMTMIGNLDKKTDDAEDDPITWSDLVSMLPSLIIPFGIVFVFVVYYIIASKRQKVRLQSLQNLKGYNHLKNENAAVREQNIV